MSKRAEQLKAGDSFRGVGRTDFLTCVENRGTHPFYGQLIDTKERGTLSMPADYQVEVESAPANVLGK